MSEKAKTNLGKVMSYTLLMDYVQKQAWAIIPHILDTIHQILYNRTNGIDINLEEVEQKLGAKLNNKYELQQEGGVAVIPIHGVIAKRMNMFHAMSGGVSTELIKRDISAALEDTNVSSILLDIDSPGGTVDGTKDLADFIFNSRGKKPITAIANELMASAAYWIGSAADKVVAYDTAKVGSIGVIATHYDYSKSDEKKGIKVTHITAGKYKALGNDAEPLSEEGRDYIQGFVDNAYSFFVDAIARNRGIDTETVLKSIANGKVFTTEKAIELGLVDEIGTIESVIGEGKPVRVSVKAEVKSGDVFGNANNSTEQTIIENKSNSKGGKEIMELTDKDYETLKKNADKAEELESKLEATTKTLEEQGKVIGEQKKALASLEVSLTVMNENAESDLAKSTKQMILVDSELPEGLHKLVSKTVDHKDFKAEDKPFKEGSEAHIAFTGAFKAEVKKVEESLHQDVTVGLSSSKEDTDLKKGVREGAFAGENKDIVKNL